MFQPLIKAFRSLMRNLQSLVTLCSLVKIRQPLVMMLLSLVRILKLPSMTHRLLSMTCLPPKGCSRAAAGLDFLSVSATVASSGVLSWICARWRFVSVTVAFSGALLLSCGMHMGMIASICPSCSNTPSYSGATVRATAGAVDVLAALFLASRFALN